MTIRKHDFMLGLGFAVFCFFVFTVDFRTDLFRNTYLAYACAISSVFLLYFGARCRPSKKLSLPVLLWLLSMSFLLAGANISSTIKYAIGLSLLYCYADKNGAKEYTVSILAIAAGIFAFCTFLFYMFPGLYLVHVVPHLEEYLQPTAVAMINTERYPGLTGHYSTNGTYLAIGLGAVFAFALTEPKRRKTKWLAFTLLMFAALLLIGKRAHLAFSAASCFAVYWIAHGNQKRSRLVKVLGFVITGTALFVLAVQQIPALGNTFNRFVETAENGDFFMSRTVLYAEAWKQFTAHPVFGCGWRSLIGSMDHDAHNIYIQLLAETGIVGFLLFTGLIFYGVAAAVRNMDAVVKNDSLYSDRDKRMVYFAAYYLIFFAVYGMTGNPLYDEQPFYLFMISYGIALYYKKKTGLQTALTEKGQMTRG